jgi:hypothetical protein
MEEEFVPYELALRMKTLGFNENCYRVGNPNGAISWRFMDVAGMEGVGIDNLLEVEFDDRWVEIPTYSQTFRWFREKYSIHCEITQTTDWEEDNESWNFVIYKYKLGNNDGMKDSDVDFNTYEEAELECLKKLIEIVEQKIKD